VDRPALGRFLFTVIELPPATRSRLTAKSTSRNIFLTLSYRGSPALEHGLTYQVRGEKSFFWIEHSYRLFSEEPVEWRSCFFLLKGLKSTLMSSQASDMMTSMVRELRIHASIELGSSLPSLSHLLIGAWEHIDYSFEM